MVLVLLALAPPLVALVHLQAARWGRVLMGRLQKLHITYSAGVGGVVMRARMSPLIGVVVVLAVLL